jgi:hypothetical protein
MSTSMVRSARTLKYNVRYLYMVYLFIRGPKKIEDILFNEMVPIIIVSSLRITKRFLVRARLNDPVVLYLKLFWEPSTKSDRSLRVTVH